MQQNMANALGGQCERQTVIASKASEATIVSVRRFTRSRDRFVSLVTVCILVYWFCYCGIVVW